VKRKRIGRPRGDIKPGASGRLHGAIRTTSGYHRPGIFLSSTRGTSELVPQSGKNSILLLENHGLCLISLEHHLASITTENGSRRKVLPAGDIMRVIILAFASLLATSQVHAQSCITSGSSISCDNGVSGLRSGNSIIWNDGSSSIRSGSSTFDSDGTSAIHSGNSTSYSDGTSSIRSGNSTFFSNGHSCIRSGNLVSCN
jgi:uncharacterized Zn-binding protein involved in type VI secretion